MKLFKISLSRRTRMGLTVMNQREKPYGMIRVLAEQTKKDAWKDILDELN